MSEFGYSNYTCLASQNTTDFGCADPDHSVFYIPGHPSAVVRYYIYHSYLKHSSLQSDPRTNNTVFYRCH
ncbi:hypothetical protein K439DRAFT_1628702 [Ramaria rubella]|nr:hypothetical protein K439DRAFT_1628702 [Ramaria rubella]